MEKIDTLKLWAPHSDVWECYEKETAGCALKRSGFYATKPSICQTASFEHCMSIFSYFFDLLGYCPHCKLGFLCMKLCSKILELIGTCTHLLDNFHQKLYHSCLVNFCLTNYIHNNVASIFYLSYSHIISIKSSCITK